MFFFFKKYTIYALWFFFFTFLVSWNTERLIMLNFFVCFFLLFYLLSFNINNEYLSKRDYLFNLYKKYIFYYCSILQGLVFNLFYINNYFKSFLANIVNIFFVKFINSYLYTPSLVSISTFSKIFCNKFKNVFTLSTFLMLHMQHAYYYSSVLILKDFNFVYKILLNDYSLHFLKSMEINNLLALNNKLLKYFVKTT
jgi:hypothetical protein